MLDPFFGVGESNWPLLALMRCSVEGFPSRICDSFGARLLQWVKNRRSGKWRVARERRDMAGCCRTAPMADLSKLV